MLCFILKVKNFILSRRSHNRFTWLRTGLRVPVARPRRPFDARFEVEVELGALKENHSKLAEQLKETIRVRDSAEAGLKTT